MDAGGRAVTEWVYWLERFVVEMKGLGSFCGM
jgi:hypothetical protein